jgi:selenocysteine-specific elongation factor
MYVVATAGHVDHGKSALVRRLTGMEPDRWAEERRRGMTIDLGFAWMSLPSGDEVAFVDVPGHERFITNMLAGVGPAPAVLLVVAADEGWMPQTAEHVAALDALGVQHAILVVTKCDLADAQPVIDDVSRRLASTTMGVPEAVAVSSATGAGIDAMTSALARLTHAMPAADDIAPVRLWVDRAFTIQGAGTVVTGTLGAGTIRVGDRLALGDDVVVVRGLQSLGTERSHVTASARVAVNVRAVDRADVPRGTALVTPGAWRHVSQVDVLLSGDRLANDLMTHVGSAAVPTRVRHLGDGAARLQLSRSLPLAVGDRLLLREPAARAVMGATVADVEPPVLRRRGDGARVAAALGRGERWIDPARVRVLPSPARPTGDDVDLSVIAGLLERLAYDPFDAPNQDELRTLDRAVLGHAARSGRLLHLGAGIYIAAGAPAIAVERFGKLDQPFSVSEARQALNSTRRVVVPLLEHLDAARLTRRLADGTRILVAPAG